MINQLDLHDFRPCLLVATPQLRDPHFHQTVVFLIEYKPEGAFGLIINRPLNVALGSVEAAEVEIADRYRNTPLWFGGPVSPNDVLCLYDVGREGPLDHDELISTKIAVAPAERLLAKAPLTDHFPGDFRVFVGSAMWEEEQLDAELQAGSWIVSPLQHDLLLSSDADTCWRVTLQRMGINPDTYHDAPSDILN